MRRARSIAGPRPMMRSNSAAAGGRPAVSRVSLSSASRSSAGTYSAATSNGTETVRTSSTQTACMAGVPGLTWMERSARGPNVERA